MLNNVISTNLAPNKKHYITREAAQENLTHTRKKKQPIETDPEM